MEAHFGHEGRVPPPRVQDTYLIVWLDESLAPGQGLRRRPAHRARVAPAAVSRHPCLRVRFVPEVPQARTWRGRQGVDPGVGASAIQHPSRGD